MITPPTAEAVLRRVSNYKAIKWQNQSMKSRVTSFPKVSKNRGWNVCNQSGSLLLLKIMLGYILTHINY